MRNYREVAKNRNVLAWGIGISQVSQYVNNFLDLKTINSTNRTYRAIEDGELFFVGFSHNEIENLNMDIVLQQNFSRQANTRMLPTHSLNFIGKRTVVKNEVIAIPEGLIGTIFLTPLNTNISSFKRDIKIATASGSINHEYVRSSNGYAFVNCISLIQSLGFRFVPSSFCYILSNEPNFGHSLLFSPISRFNLQLDTNTDGTFISDLYSIELSDKPFKVLAFEPLSPSVIEAIKINYDRPNNGSIVVNHDGIFIFAGAYQTRTTQPPTNNIPSMTKLHEKTVSFNSFNQTHIIAYQNVKKGDIINYYGNSADRFGGTFYAIERDSSELNFSIGNAAITSNSINFRKPSDNKIMIGSFGNGFGSSLGSLFDLSNIPVALTTYMDNLGAIGNFVACDAINIDPKNISFICSKGSFDGQQDMFEGVFVEF